MKKQCWRWIRPGFVCLLAVLIGAGMLPVQAFAAVELDKSHLGVSVLYARDASGFASCAWTSVSGVRTSDADGVRTWYVGETDMRYMEVGISVNIGSSAATVGAKSVEVSLPYYRDGTGRDDASRAYYVHSSSVSGISISADRTGNRIVVTNTSALGANDHRSVVVYYKFDCWNMPSGKRFDVGYDATANGVLTDGVLSGTIVTDLDMTVADTYHIVPGFARVANSSHYMDRYSSAYGKYFGLTEAEFRAGSEDYIYDIMTVTVDPAGQQPYGISGTVVPGQYPLKSQTGNYGPYGWDGEVLAGIYMPKPDDEPDRFVPVSISGPASSSYDDLPGSGLNSDLSNQSGVTNSQSHTWKKYPFRIDYDDLPVVSAFSDGQTDSYDDYTLSFLIRYPRNTGSLEYVNKDRPETSGFRLLSAAVEIVHTGIDSGKSVAGLERRQLYFNLVDQVDCSGDIYSGTYQDTYSMMESKNGLSQLKAGNKAVVDLTADFYCLNENRDGQVLEYTDHAVKNTYTLEAIIDVALLSDIEDHSAMMLGEGDYRIASYGLSIIDNYGTCTKNEDGTWYVGWADYTVPSEFKDDPVYIYGSERMYGNADSDWVLINQATLGAVWAKNTYRSLQKSDMSTVRGHDFVRLKVVYPNSRLTTAIRVGYSIELLPTGNMVGRAVENAVENARDSLILTSWCNYTAYLTGDYDRLYPNPSIRIDLDTRRDAITSDADTGSVVRDWDQAHPYPGYSSTASTNAYPYRNFIMTALGSSTDSVGMSVSQMLFTASGLEGTDYDYTDPYSKHTVATNVDRVVYRLMASATDSYNSQESVLERRERDITGSMKTPYVSTHFRYYALLPEDMMLDEASVGHWKKINCGDTSHDSHRNYASDVNVPGIPLSVPDAAGRERATTWHWNDTGRASDVSVQRMDVNGRELLIFDRVTRYPDTVNAHFLPGNLLTELYRYVWGLGVEFAIIPKDGAGSLPAGNYETLFVGQFLDDEGNPIVLDGYAGGVYASASDAFSGIAAGRIDENLLTELDGTKTFTAIASASRNRSGAGNSSAEIKVRNEAPEQDASYGYETRTALESGEYSYELTYRIDNGSSDGVVLWNNIEQYDRSGLSSEWTGTLAGVDLNNTGARVYVNTSDSIDVDTYLTGNGNADPASAEWLRAGKDGWTEVTDPESYQGWADVRAIAFWFDGTTFRAGGAGDMPGSASVYLRMRAPVELTDVTVRKEYYTAYNEILFSDRHIETDLSATVLAKPVSIRVTFEPEETDAGYELPKTGGAGTSGYFLAGVAVLFVGAALLVVRKRRRSS